MPGHELRHFDAAAARDVIRNSRGASSVFSGMAPLWQAGGASQGPEISNCASAPMQWRAIV